MALNPETKPNLTPSEAREQLARMGLSNEVGDALYRSELRSIIRAADEVVETDPVDMARLAEGFERNAVEYERLGKDFSAQESWQFAALYRRNVARALANDNAQPKKEAA